MPSMGDAPVRETPEAVATRLFRPIAPGYERGAAVLSLGQDARWRRHMVADLKLRAGSLVLDVAAGTGSISRLLESEGHRVVAVDLSPEMLSHHSGRHRIRAIADHLPFADATFDAVTFGYLLRYVEDPAETMRELTRVLHRGGAIGMVEFGCPRWVWGVAWRAYTRAVLPIAGRALGSGWYDMGRFLGPSIEQFHRNYRDLSRQWEDAGLVDIKVHRPSLGGGLVMWAHRA